MTVNQLVVGAAPARVFEVLLDPPTYAYWVVGNQAIRAVDADWPNPGSRFHHRLGLGPLRLEDCSTVRAIEPTRFRLELEVRLGRLGRGNVELTVEPVGAGAHSVVTLVEVPTGGPMKRLSSPPVDALLGARNRWSLRRLRRVAERRPASARSTSGSAGPAGRAGPTSPAGTPRPS